MESRTRRSLKGTPDRRKDEEGRPTGRDLQEDHVYADKRLVIARTTLPGLLSIMGAIDAFNASSVVNALEEELQSGRRGPDGTASDTADGPLQIDLSRLEFVDTHGIRALLKVAESASACGGVVFRGLAPRIRQAIHLAGLANVPGLVIDEAD